MSEPVKRQSKESYMRGNLMRRKILSISRELGWTYMSTGNVELVDIMELDRWMLRYGYLHKGLNYYTPEELPKLVTQFEEMAAKMMIKKSTE